MVDISEAYRRLGELTPEGFDITVAYSLAGLRLRADAAGIAEQLTIPGLDPGPAELADLLVDEVIRLGSEFERLGRADDFVAARELVVALLRGAGDPLNYANALGMLAHSLTGYGRPAEALVYTEECAAVLRPHMFDDDGTLGLYARAVRDCGTNLAELNRPQEAAAAKREALRFYERCLAGSPRFRPDVALTCKELFGLLMWCGEHEEAFTVSDRAIELMQELAPEFPGFRGELADVMRLRAAALYELGRVGEAVQFAARAVDTYRDLAAEWCLPFLTETLLLLSDVLSAVDRDEEALDAAAEAVQLADATDAVQAKVTYGWRLVEHGRLLEAKEILLSAASSCPPDPAERLTGLLDHLSRLLAGEGYLGEAESVVLVTARRYKILSGGDPVWLVAYARFLGWQAELQFHRGHHEAALRTAERAVRIAERSENRETHARALGHLGSSLAGTRRHEEAEATSRKALALWQELAEDDPETYRSALASAWNNLANKLGPLGRHEEATHAAQRAVALYEQTDNVGDLANSLNGLAVRLHHLGRDELACEAAERAVAYYDELTPEQPGYLRELAVVLANLAGYRAALGDLEQAWRAAARAASIRHGLYAKDPEAIEEDLLSSLRAASDFAAALGRFHRAAEATAIRVNMFEARGGVELAEALIDYGGLLTGIPPLENAVAVLERADALCMDIPEVPALHAFCLDKLAWCRAQLGDPEEAVRLARRAIALLDPIEQEEGNPHLPNLGVTLDDLSEYLVACGRLSEALEAAGRAVSVRERLGARHGSALAESLRQLGRVLRALGREVPAENAFRRAEELTVPTAAAAVAEAPGGLTVTDLARGYERYPVDFFAGVDVTAADFSAGLVPEMNPHFDPAFAQALRELAAVAGDVTFADPGHDGPVGILRSLTNLAGELCSLRRPHDEVLAVRIIVALLHGLGDVIENAEAERALAIGRLGSALIRAGQFAEAALTSLQATELLHALVEAGHSGLRFFQVQAHEDAGHALHRLGDLPQAAIQLQEAITIYDQICVEDPVYRSRRETARQALARVLAEEERVDESQE
ncbi:tetratricopeptide repeat protein [Microbispora sp. NBC_01389]|uniref:tetratricopeptide repeat protein n=1 Tax=Microbispora sp. NBC_01389 TaxID=2903584 RepID=UPI0032497706